MGSDDKTVRPPSLALLTTEGRGLLDIPALFAAAPFLATAPRGQPHPVMVLPGLGADDRSTIAIRGFLNALGLGSRTQCPSAGHRRFCPGYAGRHASERLRPEG
jgi:hypothetical protein